MISEEELRALSYADAPKIVTDEIPGPKSRKILEDVPKYESMIRPPGTAAPPVFDEAMGVTVKDSDSNLYIDMGAGVAVTNVGRRHPRVLRAIEEQCKKILHAGEVTNPRRSELAKRIAGIMPEGLRNNCVTYFALSGSGAVETTIKLVRHITGRDKLVAFHGAYHGVWCGSLSLTATATAHAGGWGSLIPNVIHLPYAYCYRCPFGLAYPACELQCGKYVDHVLTTPGAGAKDIAAVFVEPLQAEGGYIPPPVEFLQMVKAAAEKCGALFVSIELVKDKETKEPLEFDRLKQILDGILADGVIAYPCGRYMNVLRLMPALTMPKDYLNKAIDIILTRIREGGSDRVT